MRPKLRACLRYRPRILTLIVLIVVAATLVLANLSVDSVSQSLMELYAQAWGMTGKFVHKSYGWPLIWHRYVYTSGYGRTVGWYYSAPRLAGNLAMWLVLLAAPAAACEWLLRRYRPRLRWSLRTMLVAIGLAAALCGWFAVARDRANSQDSLTALVNGGKGRLFVQRWGPKWLDFVGVDRYRRHISAAALGSGFGLSGFKELRAGDAVDEELLQRMARLPKLQVLFLAVDRMSPGMADSLGEMRHLRKLCVMQSAPVDDDGRSSRACLAAIGKLTQLESLHLSGMTLDRESPARLGGLMRLKSLYLGPGWNPHKYDKPVSHRCLAVIGKMLRVESLDLSGMTVDAEGLAHLAGLANLKAIRLSLDGGPSADHLDERVSQECLAAIGKMSQLEILDLSGKTIDSEGLACLGGLTNLKSFSLYDSNIWANSEEGDDAAPRPPLDWRLPALPRLELVDIYSSRIDDRDLRRLAVLPRLKSLHLDETPVTDAGLAELASLQFLEELSLDGGMVSGAGLEALLAVKRLKTLHVGTYTFAQDAVRHDEFDRLTEVTLDDERKVRVWQSKFDGVVRALQALRRCKPGIVIDTRTSAVSWKESALWQERDRPVKDIVQTLWFDHDASPEPHQPGPGWLPSNGAPWMTPTERALFEKEGGWARFDAAGWATKDGPTTSF